MEILKKVKIFPDPVFCGGPVEGEHQECHFLVHNEDCGLFTNEEDDDFAELEKKMNALGEEIATKCDQCKEAIKNSSQNQNN